MRARRAGWRSVVTACCALGVAAVMAPGLAGRVAAEEPGMIKLNAPDKERGLPFMKALAVKASAREWSDRDLSLQDLSDLLWAATGLNRPEEDKTTASSAMNAHDVDVYVFMKDGAYLYDIRDHALRQVLAGDHRSELMKPRPPRPAGAGESAPPGPGGPGSPGGPPPAAAGGPGAPPAGAGGPGGPPPGPESNPPVQIILVSDSTRFRTGAQELRYEWGAIDTGIVSQNISLFCAATGLKTRPRASVDKEKIKSLLQLKDTQYVLLNHPVGYAK